MGKRESDPGKHGSHCADPCCEAAVPIGHAGVGVCVCVRVCGGGKGGGGYGCVHMREYVCVGACVCACVR